MKPVYLLVVKQSGQNNRHVVYAKRDKALKVARDTIEILKKFSGHKLTDRKKYGLAVTFRAATIDAQFGDLFAIVEVYEMQVQS